RRRPASNICLPHLPCQRFPSRRRNHTCSARRRPSIVVHGSAVSSAANNRQVTRRELLTYALAAPVLAGMVASAVEAPRANAANGKRIDFAVWLLDADQGGAA